MSAKLHFLAEDAANCVQEALRAEAVATHRGVVDSFQNEHDPAVSLTRQAAERRAHTALSRIEALAYYAKELEDKVADMNKFIDELERRA